MTQILMFIFVIITFFYCCNLQCFQPFFAFTPAEKSANDGEVFRSPLCAFGSKLSVFYWYCYRLYSAGSCKLRTTVGFACHIYSRFT